MELRAQEAEMAGSCRQNSGKEKATQKKASGNLRGGFLEFFLCVRLHMPFYPKRFANHWNYKETQDEVSVFRGLKYSAEFPIGSDFCFFSPLIYTCSSLTSLKFCLISEHIFTATNVRMYISDFLWRKYCNHVSIHSFILFISLTNTH